MKIQKPWTTHMPVLIKVLQHTEGPVLEIGAGPFSTPLLHWLCAEKRRKLLTIDHNENYWRMAKGFATRNHRTIWSGNVDGYDNVKEIDQKWDVVFIDHAANRRRIELDRVKDNANYIVLHDTSSERYAYGEVFPKFKYRYDWTFCRPWTSVVSNKKPLDFLYENK